MALGVQFGDNINASLKNALGLLNHGMGDKMLQNQNNNLPDIRTSTGNFDVLRSRYFPGGPGGPGGPVLGGGPGAPTPPEGPDSDLMFKHMTNPEEHYPSLVEARHRSREREGEEMLTDNT